MRVKLSCYQMEKQCSLSVEDYLKAFLETEVKPLWPKGWMQARWVCPQVSPGVPGGSVLPLCARGLCSHPSDLEDAGTAGSSSGTTETCIFQLNASKSNLMSIKWWMEGGGQSGWS